MVVWIEIWYASLDMPIFCVTTCVVVWIEIFGLIFTITYLWVTTCVVVWIEIRTPRSSIYGRTSSPPAWWCGLKSIHSRVYDFRYGHHLRGGVD